jgi:hypothetical protein
MSNVWDRCKPVIILPAPYRWVLMNMLPRNYLSEIGVKNTCH